MPFFPKKGPKGVGNNNGGNNNAGNNNNEANQEVEVGNGRDDRNKEEYLFYCQQAQGSQIGIISGFNNVKELYQKISECYDFDPSEILFCTLNTYKVNMNKLLGGQIALDDFIFVHRKGRPKEIELTKKEEALGLTITDNGNGLAFIKRIKPGSVIDGIPVIQVGDHIEKIDDINLVGKRHFEVAKCLKEIPLGTTFTLRLVSPLQAGFSNIGPREDRGRKKGNYGSGKETLRFKAGGAAVVEVVDNEAMFEKAVEAMNELLENYIGINDSELAARFWEISEGKRSREDFIRALGQSELNDIGFSNDFMFQLWDVVRDARVGNL